MTEAFSAGFREGLRRGPLCGSLGEELAVGEAVNGDADRFRCGLFGEELAGPPNTRTPDAQGGGRIGRSCCVSDLLQYKT